MQSMVRRLFWCEVGLSLAAAVVLVATLAWPHWIELTLGVDPDHGGGSAEWMIAAGSALAATVSGALARYAGRLRTQRRQAAAGSAAADAA